MASPEQACEMNKLKKEQMDIAVIGRSGVGKSSLINAIRGDIDESQPDYALVGCNECTKVLKSYPHPDNKLLKFWDFPGVETDLLPRKNYFKRKEIGFHTFDMFILVACDRCTEDETLLAKEVQKTGKPLLFVRTKIDLQIKSEAIQKRKANKIPNPAKVIEEIREKCKEHLKEMLRLSTDIYLINNYDINQENLDFEKLLRRLSDSFNELKGCKEDEHSDLTRMERRRIDCGDCAIV